MTEFDYALLAIIGISTLMSLTKGLIKEAMSLATWIAAFFLAPVCWHPKPNPFWRRPSLIRCT